MITLENKARDFATYWHGSINQVRKYTNDPYICHPEAVATLVRTIPHDEQMLAAAWLHDVVEDTPVTIELIAEEFGPDVADLVGWLTDVSKPSDGKRAERKKIDREHTKGAPPRAKTVKLGDLIDNSRTIMAYDRGFARIYLKEKRLLLDEALTEGDPTLWCMADKIVRGA